MHAICRVTLGAPGFLSLASHEVHMSQRIVIKQLSLSDLRAHLCPIGPRHDSHGAFGACCGGGASCRGARNAPAIVCRPCTQPIADEHHSCCFQHAGHSQVREQQAPLAPRCRSCDARGLHSCDSLMNSMTRHPHHLSRVSSNGWVHRKAGIRYSGPCLSLLWLFLCP